MLETTESSLRDSTLEKIKSFLYDEGFESCPDTSNGILSIINLISDYHEEGVPLFPEIIIIKDFTPIEGAVHHRIEFKSPTVKKSDFDKVLKTCAPLATCGWTIYIITGENELHFGLINAEITETAPSLFWQTVGNQQTDDTSLIAYIRNVGQKTVELSGRKKRLIVSLTLGSNKDGSRDDILSLSKAATKDLESETRTDTENYLHKVFCKAIKQGHGCLVGIVQDDDVSIENAIGKLNDGAYFKAPIDLNRIIATENEIHSNESSTELNAYGEILAAMLNHDGITLMTSKAKLIGYHIFIRSEKDDKPKPQKGGARHRAFCAMIEVQAFNSCFYRSQDGNSIFWQNQ